MEKGVNIIKKVVLTISIILNFILIIGFYHFYQENIELKKKSLNIEEYNKLVCCNYISSIYFPISNLDISLFQNKKIEQSPVDNKYVFTVLNETSYELRKVDEMIFSLKPSNDEFIVAANYLSSVWTYLSELSEKPMNNVSLNKHDINTLKTIISELKQLDSMGMGARNYDQNIDHGNPVNYLDAMKSSLNNVRVLCRKEYEQLKRQ